MVLSVCNRTFFLASHLTLDGLPFRACLRGVSSVSFLPTVAVVRMEKIDPKQSYKAGYSEVGNCSESGLLE
jgi:hypothetical protein